MKAMQFGALCYRIGDEGVRLLLITTRRTGRWSVPKGWPIAGKSARDVARIEAFEEAGIIGKVGAHSLGTFAYEKYLGYGKLRACIVRVYPLMVTAQSENFPEKGQRLSEWVSLDEATERVGYPALGNIIRKFAEKVAAEQTLAKARLRTG